MLQPVKKISLFSKFSIFGLVQTKKHGNHSITPAVCKRQHKVIEDVGRYGMTKSKKKKKYPPGSAFQTIEIIVRRKKTSCQLTCPCRTARRRPCPWGCWRRRRWGRQSPARARPRSPRTQARCSGRTRPSRHPSHERCGPGWLFSVATCNMQQHVVVISTNLR